MSGGASPLHVVARHFTADGAPLLTAAELATVYGIKQRTVYQWRRRGFLTVHGLDDNGRELYDAGKVATVKAKPYKRKAA